MLTYDYRKITIYSSCNTSAFLDGVLNACIKKAKKICLTLHDRQALFGLSQFWSINLVNFFILYFSFPLASKIEIHVSSPGTMSKRGLPLHISHMANSS